jgi:ribosomal protein S21
MRVFVQDSNVMVALRKLRKKLEREGMPGEMKKREYAMRPGEKRRSKHRQAVKRYRKAATKLA